MNGDIIELEQKLDNFREEDPRKAAEVACALAVLHQRAGNTEKAKEVARDTLGLMGRCELDSLEDVVAKNMSLGGVMLPQYFHHRRVIRFFEDNGIRLY